MGNSCLLKKCGFFFSKTLDSNVFAAHQRSKRVGHPRAPSASSERSNALTGVGKCSCQYISRTSLIHLPADQSRLAEDTGSWVTDTVHDLFGVDTRVLLPDISDTSGWASGRSLVSGISCLAPCLIASTLILCHYS
ncbi:hypothetical protein PC122_g12773 [Phytophthora cactorum]|nr:hypothetical protein PC122_g12773 [Phytophthora cactorum]